MKVAQLLLVLGSLFLLLPLTRAANTEQQLQALKAQFPAMRVQKVSLDPTNPKADKIEIQIPHVDVWSKYRGTVLSANLTSLPIVITRLEGLAKTDAEACRKQAETVSGKSAKAQARGTAEWLNGPLREYLRKLKGLQAPGPG